MGQLGGMIDKAGCPSGLQKVPVAERDPLGREVDLSAYIETRKSGRSYIDLIVTGAHCAGCVAKIERGLTELSGVEQVRLNLSTSRLVVNWDGKKTDLKTIIHKLSDLGFGAGAYEVSAAEKDTQTQLKFLLRCLAVAGFALMNVMVISIAVWSGGAEMQHSTRSLFHWVSALIAIPAVLYAGRPFFDSAWSALKKRRTNMDVPISLAMLLALGLSVYETVYAHPDTYFDAALMLVFLLLIGRYLDRKLRARTGEAARRLAAMQVTSATRIGEDGQMHTVPAGAIQIGDVVLIPAGQNIAVDGDILSGSSDLDTQIVTGETLPRRVGVGDKVYSGMTNLGAPLTIMATARHENSFLSEITRLVEAGEQSRSHYVRLADRAARIYVPFVHSVAALTFLGWLILGGDLRQASLCAIAVLIITCPCALGLAVPAVNVVSAGELFKRGVLLKSGDALERLAQIDHVVFDKTGTVTTGQLQVNNMDELDPRMLLMAASLARYSDHPLAAALARAVPEAQMVVTEIREQAGGGISGNIDGLRVSLGSAEFLKLVPEVSNSQHFDLTEDVDGGAGSWFQLDDSARTAPIYISFTDMLRPEAKNIVRDLEALDLSSELLSGDNTEITARTAKALGVHVARGQVKPAQKRAHIEELKASGVYPLMVGDGINDAPALSTATASVSLSTASDISRSTADIILQHDNLNALPFSIKTARRAQSRIRENFALAVFYNLCAIPLAIFGFVNPLIAALAMSSSSLLVTLNALRMKQMTSVEKKTT